MVRSYMMKPIVLLFSILLFCAAGVCRADGGTGEYELPWAQHDEVLMYHACGCADACWVAEVRARANNAVRARLSCDCESLSYAAGAKAAVRPLNESCARINESEHKPALIKQKLEDLRVHGAAGTAKAP